MFKNLNCQKNNYEYHSVTTKYETVFNILVAYSTYQSQSILTKPLIIQSCQQCPVYNTTALGTIEIEISNDGQE